MAKKLLFIYNPAAGKAKISEKLDSILGVFDKFNCVVTAHPTACRGDGRDFVRNHGCEFDTIVCAGGDGTLNEIISGAVAGGVKCPIGFIPTGSANDTATTLSIPHDALLAAETAVTGTPFPFDIGKFNDGYFVYVAAFGAFSDVSYATPQEMKNSLGHMAYILEGIKSVPSIHPTHMRVSWDGGEVEDNFIFGAVCNTLSVGGGVLKFSAERESLHDGKFEVLLIRHSNLLDIGHAAHSLLNQSFDDKSIIHFQTDRLELFSENPVAWAFDGEDGGAYTRAHIECLPRPVTIMSGFEK